MGEDDTRHLIVITVLFVVGMWIGYVQANNSIKQDWHDKYGNPQTVERGKEMYRLGYQACLRI